MKLALITPGFSADASDWCIPALRTLVTWLAREHEVHVFTLRYPHRRARYRLFGATVHALGGATVGGVGRGPLLARALLALLREARRAPFDMIRGLWADEPGALAVLAGRLLGVPALVSLLGGELERRPELGYGTGLSRVGRRLVTFALHGAARVTVGSEFLYQRALPHVPAGRLARLPLGVDTVRFAPGVPRADPLGAGRSNLLHVASLVPIKNQAMLLRAFARVARAEPTVQLHLVGEGPLRAELVRQAGALGVGGRVTFHGAVAHERLPDYYRSAELHLLSSEFESQGMSVLEAAACGVPTVGTAVGVLPELAPDVARVVPVGNERALAAGVRAVLADPVGRVRMGRHGVARVRAGWGVEQGWMDL